MGEEGVALGHVTDAPFLGRQVDAGAAVEGGEAVDSHQTLVRPEDAGDGLEREALPRARRPEQDRDLVAGAEGGGQVECTQASADVYFQHGPTSARLAAAGR